MLLLCYEGGCLSELKTMPVQRQVWLQLVQSAVLGGSADTPLQKSEAPDWSERLVSKGVSVKC